MKRSKLSNQALLHTGELDTGSTDMTSIQAITKGHVECLEVKNCSRTKREVFVAVLRENFFIMISLFVIFICEDRKKRLLAYMKHFSVLCGQNASHQLATSSENLVASAQVLVALETSELQFRALTELF